MHAEHQNGSVQLSLSNKLPLVLCRNSSRGKFTFKKGDVPLKLNHSADHWDADASDSLVLQQTLRFSRVTRDRPVPIPAGR